MKFSSEVMAMGKKNAPDTMEIKGKDISCMVRVMEVGLDALGQVERDEMARQLESMGTFIRMALECEAGKTPMVFMMEKPGGNS